jgi:hypothetical protein
VDEGGTPRPVWRRPRLVGPTIAAVVLLTAGGIFAAVASKGPGPKPSAAAPAAPLNTVPFTGTYRVDYGPATDLDGKPVETAPPGSTVTWGVRSACRPAGCVATASRLGGESFVSGMVFDDVGGRWVAVVLVSDPCINPPAEFWAVFTLQPRADGTLAGEWSCRHRSAQEFDDVFGQLLTGVFLDEMTGPVHERVVDALCAPHVAFEDVGHRTGDRIAVTERHQHNGCAG